MASMPGLVPILTSPAQPVVTMLSLRYHTPMIFALASFCLGFFFLLSRHRREIKEPGYFGPSPGLVASSATFLFYLVPALFYCMDPAFSSDLRAYLGFSDELYVYVSFLGLLAVIFSYQGYRFGIRFFRPQLFSLTRALDRLAESIPPAPLAVATTILLGLGLSTDIYKQASGNVHFGGSLSIFERETSSISLLFAYASGAMWAAFYALTFLFLTKRLNKPLKVVYLGALAATLSNAGLSGGAFGLIRLTTPFFIFYLYRTLFPFPIHYKITRRSVLLLVLTTVTVLATAFSFKIISRGMTEYQTAASLHDAFMNPDVLLSAIDNFSFAQALENFLNYVGMGANSMAVILDRIESRQQSFEYGGTLALVFVAFIPRVFYPSKPEISLGMWFTDNYWRDWRQVTIAGEGTQSTSFLLPGDFYINFGTVGVVIGMFLVGIIMAYLTRRSFVKMPSTRTVPLEIVSFTLISRIYIDLVSSLFSFAGFITSLVQDILSVYLIMLVLLLIAKLMSYIMIDPRARYSSKHFYCVPIEKSKE